MKRTTPSNLAASIRQKLLNIASRQREDFGLVVTRYGLERLLYRISQSRSCDQFVPKGAMLFQTWRKAPHRPTRDLDLLGYGDPSPENSVVVFQEVCGIATPDDGLVFPAEAVTAERIQEDEEYEGVRMRLLARMANIRIPLQVDIGYGDALTRRPSAVDYPTLLPMPGPRIQGYPMEAVIAEKLDAIIQLGMLNSRMKDFFDIWFLARTFSFDASSLGTAIHATLKRRGTPIDLHRFEILIGELSSDASKLIQWRAFLSKSKLTAPSDFVDIVSEIRKFASVPFGARSGETASWLPGGPWRGADSPR